MAGKKGQKKRFWADEEKRSICEQALVPGVSVAQVARRYAMNANLIFKWLKDLSYAELGSCGRKEPLPATPHLAGSGGGWIARSLVMMDRARV